MLHALNHSTGPRRRLLAKSPVYDSFLDADVFRLVLEQGHLSLEYDHTLTLRPDDGGADTIRHEVGAGVFVK